ALSLIAYIIVQLSDKHPTQAKVILGVTVFLFLANYLPWLNLRIAQWNERRRDDAVARNTFPEFREFVHRFGPFIDSRVNDTLQAIVRTEIVQRRNDNNAAFNLPNMALFHGWWDYFWQRLDRQPRTITEVRAALMEFHLLVGSYTNYCVTPIFELSPNLK